MTDDLTEWEMITDEKDDQSDIEVLQSPMSISENEEVKCKATAIHTCRDVEEDPNIFEKDFKRNQLIKCLETISKMPVRSRPVSPCIFAWDRINWKALFVCLNVCTTVGVAVGHGMGYTSGYSAGVRLRVISESECLCATDHKLQWCSDHHTPSRNTDNVTNPVLSLEAQNSKLRVNIQRLQQQLKNTERQYMKAEQKSQKLLEINKEILVRMEDQSINVVPQDQDSRTTDGKQDDILIERFAVLGHKTKYLERAANHTNDAIIPNSNGNDPSRNNSSETEKGGTIKAHANTGRNGKDLPRYKEVKTRDAHGIKPRVFNGRTKEMVQRKGNRDKNDIRSNKLEVKPDAMLTPEMLRVQRQNSPPYCKRQSVDELGNEKVAGSRLNTDRKSNKGIHESKSDGTDSKDVIRQTKKQK
ncbi:uncharacterized protein LOC121387465 [Gigantopelta aegis]|uniref:uncharacterized protein LOC121387465 n=1 Tax=Gigantopelta aegis TaxID=1735272 RepID=UPI001B888114|nr:uncharacterized protein LOC121387465 [Gigantopelta aegis]